MEKFLERLQSVLSLRVSAELSPAGLAGELVLKTGDVLQQLLAGALQHLDLLVESPVVLLELLDMVGSLHQLTGFAYLHRTLG